MNEDEDGRSGVEKLREVMSMKMDILAAQIRRLSELRDDGLLTDEEFAAKKKELLSHF